MSLTQTVDTYSAPDGRMIKRDAPYVGEWVSLADYERVAKELSDLKGPPLKAAKEQSITPNSPQEFVDNAPNPVIPPAPVKAVFHPKPITHEN